MRHMKARIDYSRSPAREVKMPKLVQAPASARTVTVKITPEVQAALDRNIEVAKKNRARRLRMHGRGFP